MIKVIIDPARLLAQMRECLDYNPETGVFTWIKIKAPNRRPLGSVAGSLDSYGYVNIGIGGRRYLAHRLAWLYMTGNWPKEEIDHRNRARNDNRWENLRLSHHGQNQMNSAVSRNNKLGVRCVYQMANGSFKASVKAHGKNYQKTFMTLNEAANYADTLRERLHGEFYSGEAELPAKESIHE